MKASSIFRSLGLALLAWAGGARAANGNTFQLFKRIDYQQTGAATLATVGCNFTATLVVPQDSLQIPAPTSVRLTGPNGVAFSLRRDGSISYYYTQDFATEAELHAAVPDGVYVISDSNFRVPIAETFTLTTGRAPTLLTDFDLLQAWTGYGARVDWNAIPDATAADFVNLAVRDPASTSASAWDTMTLNGSTSTAYLHAFIPPARPLAGSLVYSRYGTGWRIGIEFPLRIGGRRVTTIVGQPNLSGVLDGPASTALVNPGALAIDRSGNLYWTEPYCVRKMAPDGVVSTLAGNPEDIGDVLGDARTARFYNLTGIAVDAQGFVYVADSYNQSIKKISPTGIVTRLAGGNVVNRGFDDGPPDLARFFYPLGVAVDGARNVYVTEGGAVRRIGSNGVVTTLAGTRNSGYVDGPGAIAQFGTLSGIAADALGTLYVSDFTNQAIRRITPDGVVSTFARPAVNFDINAYADDIGSMGDYPSPGGLALDAAGSVYFVDTNHNLVRRISANGRFSTLAGSGRAGRQDGIGAGASFSSPGWIAVDGADNVYVPDSRTVRKIAAESPIARAPVIASEPSSQSVRPGGSALFFAASGDPRPRWQWQVNGVDLPGADGTTLTVSNVQPPEAGIYTALITGADGAATTAPAILGISSTGKVIGAGQELQPPNIVHPNGNVFDQVLLQGGAETITADAGQVTRTSFIDLNNDIVQVEFSGAGSLSVVIDRPTGPALPVNYNQPAVSYIKGHAGIVIAGANETTHVSVFTVGRATAVDPTGAFDILQPISTTNDPARNGSPLFVGHANMAYDGVADIAFIAIASANGRFGSVRAANTSFFAAKGWTGIIAPGVAFDGPVFLGDITASDAAVPALLLGSAPEVRIAGGDLWQPNGQPVRVSGVTRVTFGPGATSHNVALAAQSNRAVLEENGDDVTSRLVVP